MGRKGVSKHKKAKLKAAPVSASNSAAIAGMIGCLLCPKATQSASCVTESE